MHTIIPIPNGTAALHRNRIVLPENLAVETGSFSLWCVEAFLERTSTALCEGKPWITLKNDSNLKDEAYRIQISGSGIVIYAKTERGVV